jgi:hypothetical protein
MRGVLLAGYLLVLLAVPQPATAACSQALYRTVTSQTNAVQRGSHKCLRVLNSKRLDATQMCRICGPTFRQLIVLERTIRQNKSCFNLTKKLQREMTTLRSNLAFLKRGCGL